jgi:hypothetical protein
MNELKNVNVKFSVINITRVKDQAKQNKRTFQAELELILDQYFQLKQNKQTKQMETKNMESHTPFDQLPTSEQAWQLGYQEAARYKADIKANPYQDNSEESHQWLKGFDNYMALLYADKDE